LSLGHINKIRRYKGNVTTEREIRPVNNEVLFLQRSVRKFPAEPFTADNLPSMELKGLRSIGLSRIPSSGMLRRVALVRSDVTEEHSVSIIRVTRIGERGTTLAVTNNRLTLRRNTK
jgi:hypothetical protein